ncbi:aminoglycoside phosphotransferase [Neobacillus piezotolerans]|uniref:Aminoglycoside phosphotransferase n=1 Tax=Neobacillus piezotolerans TaxID=2259171 RepID=A0A3D8GLG6_9BACI|nr:phosphotransferase [Neobacillus piezotolerans]RDU35069.1 aminoglycoside phosphotransferase [Neobacillus piezotolerans]
MKARIRGRGPQGDDELTNRLLSYLKKYFPGNVREIIQLRPTVYYVRTSAGEFIIKGYSSFNRLILQENFTELLKTHGFRDTYSYLRPCRKEPFYANGLYFGFIEYIPPHFKQFTFQTESDRAEGLKVLKKFHHVTEKIAGAYNLSIPFANQIGKWEERFARFSANSHVISSILGAEIYDEILGWADWGLNGMKRREAIFSKGTQAILHGDVAHHNFLRSRNGRVNLIDFDLISIGPPVLDYLQYANRILPFMGWSFGALSECDGIKDFLNEVAFLHALVYPTDILREWNRILKGGSLLDGMKAEPVKEMTMHRYSARRKFIKSIQAMVK